MKTSLSFLCLLLFCLGVFIPSTISANEKGLPRAKIKCGTAIVSGKVVHYNELKRQYYDFGKVQLYLISSSPLTGNIERKKFEIKDDGSFSIEMPVDVSHAIGTIIINLADQENYYISLAAGEETKLDLYFENGTFSAKWASGPNFVFGKANGWAKVLREAIHLKPSRGYYDLDSLKSFIAEPQKYASFMLSHNLAPKLEILAKASMPKVITEQYETDIKLLTIPNMFSFQSDIQEMYALYMYNLHNKQGVSDQIEFAKRDSAAYCSSDPGLSYWAFLKRFNLNNTNYLYSNLAFDQFRKILMDCMRPAIPLIEEMPIDKWLGQAKSVLSDRIGFSKGQFYDVLVCIAYTQQFRSKGKPLSAQQIENIKKYYKGGEVEKVLLRENEKIVGSLKAHLLKHPEGVKLMDDLVFKYRGKVVVVDFWATWCGPCMNAMKEIDQIKPDYSGKDVVFVYITTESSPKDKWEAIKPNLKGEHYYLTKAEWTAVLNVFKFRGIPAYVLYDEQGNVMDSMTGYPGNDRMKELIDEALGK